MMAMYPWLKCEHMLAVEKTRDLSFDPLQVVMIVAGGIDPVHKIIGQLGDGGGTCAFPLNTNIKICLCCCMERPFL